jgi:putative endonuclease
LGDEGEVYDERRYFVYILTNPSKTLYTGVTNNLRRRIREHREKRAEGFTAKYNITRLVYFESFVDIRNAIEREKQVKAWTRAKRIGLVESVNPEWNDLSREWDQPQTFRFTSGGVKSGGQNLDPSLRSG